MLKIDISPDHLQLILDALPENGKLLEFGSGGSTRWFAEHMSEGQSLISIEHDRHWWDLVIGEVGTRRNVFVVLLERQMEFSRQSYGTPIRENPAYLHRYIASDTVVKAVREADVIFVDGVARSACLAMSAWYGQTGARVFIHDTPPRNWYDWPLRFFGERTVHEKGFGHPHGLTELVVPEARGYGQEEVTT